MRSSILASVAAAALLAAPAFAQTSGSTSSEPPAKSESKSDSAAPATGSTAGSSATTPNASGSASGSAATTSGSKSSDAAKAAPPSGAVIPTQERSQLTADSLIGMDVRNPQDEKVGKIEDLVLDSDMKVVGVVVSVGGFLGMGKHDVALNRDQVKIGMGDGNEQVATVSMTKDQLKAAPEFKTLEQQKAEAEQERAKASQGTAAGSGARPTTPPTKAQ